MNHIVKVALAVSILVTGCSEEEGTVVDERGGVIVSDDGRFSLEIPAGALEEAVDITLDEVECDQPGAVSVCYQMEPVGLPLLRPGRVAYELESADLDGVEPQAVTVLVEREELWKPLSDREVDMVDEVVTASAVYLSAFTVVVQD